MIDTDHRESIIAAFSIIGGCLVSAVMFSSLCCAFFWYKKMRQRQSILDSGNRSIPKPNLLPIIRRDDVIDFVLPAVNGRTGSSNQQSISRSSSQIDISAVNIDLYNPGLATNEEINTEKAKIGISVQYDAENQELYVKVLGALNLPTKTRGSLPDPYVKVTLLPDHQVKFTTRTLRSTANPLFNEVFVFKMAAADLNEAALKLSVRHRHDFSQSGHISSLTSINNTLGHAVIHLPDFDLTGTHEKGRRKVMWCLLQPKTLKLTSAEKGEILVSLRYEPEIGKIFVEVCRARNLVPPQQEREKLIVKLLLYERKYLIAAKRSKGIRRTEDQSLNVSFGYPLFSRTLHEASCQIIVISRTKIGTKRTLGRLTLGHRHFFTATNTSVSGSGLDHWHDMEHRPGISIQRWHQLQ